MEKLDLAREIADMYDDIVAIRDKTDSLARFATKLTDSPHNHVEIAIEEYDIHNRPVVQFIPKPIEPGEDVNEDPMPMGYSKVFQSPGNINIYSILVPTDIAMAVVDTMLKKLKAEKKAADSKLASMFAKIPEDKVYQYSINIPGRKPNI